MMTEDTRTINVPASSDTNLVTGTISNPLRYKTAKAMFRFLVCSSGIRVVSYEINQ
jgi:hypothetical protein